MCRELKDNLGSDDPEGDVPVLLQTVLSRNPNIFREKSKDTRFGVQGGKEDVQTLPLDSRAAAVRARCLGVLGGPRPTLRLLLGGSHVGQGSNLSAQNCRLGFIISVG